MTTKTLRQFQRRGTADAWTAADTVLGPGEIGFETDTLKLKVGDGVTAWTALEYVSAVDEAALDALDAARLAGDNAEAVARANAITAEATARNAAITAAINALVNSAPGALDTLKELADQMTADEGAAATLTALVNSLRNVSDNTFRTALNGSYVKYADAPSGGDDTAALQAAVDAGGLVILKPGATYRLTGTTGLTVDPSKTRLVGGWRTIIDASGMTAGVAATLSAAANNFFRNPAAGGLDGIELIGPGKASNVDGLKVVGTGTGNGYTSLFTVQRSVIHDFRVGILEGSNAWCINFIGVDAYNCATAVSNSAAATNGGERMTYMGCTFHENDLALGFTQTTGGHHFLACSFDNNTALLTLTGPHTVDLDSCHVEYVASTTTPVVLSGSLPLFRMRGGRWIQHAVNTLRSALTAGATVTSIPVNSLQSPVANGDTIVVMSAALSGTFETFTASGAAAVGANSIPVTSRTLTNSYAVGALVVDSTAAPAAIVSNSAAAGQGFGSYFENVPMAGLITTSGLFVAGPEKDRCWVNPTLIDLSCVNPTGKAITMPSNNPGGTNFFGSIGQNSGSATVAAGGTTTLDAARNALQAVTVNTASAFTFSWSTGYAAHTQDFTVEVFNNSGGALGAITWPGTVDWGGYTWVNPASTKRRLARFIWSPPRSKWVCVAMSPSEY